jgi:hypothetical protein
MSEELETIKIDFYLKLTNEAAMTTVLSDFYKRGYRREDHYKRR